MLNYEIFLILLGRQIYSVCRESTLHSLLGSKSLEQLANREHKLV